MVYYVSNSILRGIKMNKAKQREEWIDISKGILIILVVLGHSISGPFYDLDNTIDYVYLFHMPAFFIISGYLYKPLNESFSERIKKRAKRLLIPYFSYLTIITMPIIINMFLVGEPVKSIIKQIIKNLLGGQYLHNYCGVLWFITCLLSSEMIYTLIEKYIKKDAFKIIVVLVLYAIAHIEAWIYPSFKLPFAIDISLLTLSYFFIGAHFKKYILNKNVFFIASIISIISIILLRSNLISYGLELWGHHYVNLALDLLIPVSLSIVLFNICKLLIKKSIILARLGKYTFPIMALHIGLNKLLLNNSNSFYILNYLLIGLLIPLAFSLIFSRNKVLKKILL